MIYLCATPIGNLEDVTYRVVRLLCECDAVYAEDTRHTLKLLNHLDIKKPLFSCHEHNERTKAAEIVERSRLGECVVVVSDAGMPGISDPGAEVAQAAIQAGEPFTVVPGASAVLTAVVLSGINGDRFCFEGFLPREKKQRRERLAALEKSEYTTVLYESPFRLSDTLRELFEKLGDRQAAVCRELTKLHEECVRGSLPELAERFDGEVKGECVIVISGKVNSGEQQTKSIEEKLKTMAELIASGEKPKQAAKKAAEGAGASELYNMYMKQREERP